MMVVMDIPLLCIQQNITAFWITWIIRYVFLVSLAVLGLFRKKEKSSSGHWLENFYFGFSV